MRSAFAFITLMLGTIFAPSVSAQQYATGYKEAANIKELHRLSWERNGHVLQALTDVTDRQFDCRTKGWVTPIKNQRSCGSCWDFSGTGTVEMAIVRAGWADAKTFALSEQYTLDCGKNGGCDGDMPSTVLDWAKATGLPTTADYGAYQGREGSCKNGDFKKWKINSWGYVSQSEGVADTQAIKNAMVRYGPISVALAADNAFMNIRPGQVFQGSGNNGINHAVMLVGWDDNKGAWILRNSWGTEWCDQGYCLIAYGANGVGTSAAWADVDPKPVPPGPGPGPNPQPASDGSNATLLVATVIAFVLGRASRKTQTLNVKK